MTGDVYMTLQLDEVDIAKIAAIIRSATPTAVHMAADRIARDIADMLGAMSLPVTISVADIFAEECRGCGQSITTGELCANCARGNAPFFACDNAGADLKP